MDSLKSVVEQTKRFLTAESGTFDSLEQVEVLRDVLRMHEYRYYVQNDPIITDFEYDQLFKKLESIEERHPEWVTEDSPTQRVGDDSFGDRPPIVHQTAMLSLSNSYNIEDLKDFERQIRKALPEAAVKYVVEPKLDGGTVVLLYEGDKLVSAATRGNGVEGEDITLNIAALGSIPRRIPFSKLGVAKAEIRGEAIISISNFKRLNDQRTKEGEVLFANPRNAATGGLRMKNPKDTLERRLEFFAFQLSYAVDASGNNMLSAFQSHHRALEYLQEQGLHLAPDGFRAVNTIEEVNRQCQLWEENREAYPYEIDGMVIKVDDFEQQTKIGTTSHHPKWAIAYKFKAKNATTVLERVEYQVGKIGTVTPVAKLAPVALAGVTVSSASLHNEEYIKEKDLRIGDHVVVERAGDVIPYVSHVIVDLRDGNEAPIIYPKHCPSCNAELIKEMDEAYWRCINVACPAQHLQRLIHFVSKHAMNIDGLGEQLIERFDSLGWLRTITDIYRLPYDAMIDLEGMGKRSVEKLKLAIEKSKEMPLASLLHALSIHHVGRKTAKTLASQVAHILEFKDWTQERLIEVEDIGPIVAASIFNFFQEDKNIEMLIELEALGVNLKQLKSDQAKAKIDGIWSGKQVLFTGKLNEMTRSEAQKQAESLGAKVASGVSSKLDILVVGEKAGSKLKKAKELGTVEILTEQDFITLMNEKS